MGGLRALPALQPPPPSAPPAPALSAPGLCRARSPTWRAPQFPDWGARPPGNAADAPSCTPTPRGAWTPRLGASPGRLLRGRGASAAQWIPLLRPSPRTSAGDAREQLSGADAGGKHAGHRPPLGGAFGACRGPARVGGVQPRGGTGSGTVQRAQLYTVFKCSHTLRPNKPFFLNKYGLLTLFFFFCKVKQYVKSFNTLSGKPSEYFLSRKKDRRVFLGFGNSC